MNKKIMASYARAKEKAEQARAELRKYDGMVETSSPDDDQKRQKVMATINEFEARAERDRYEKVLKHWIADQSLYARRALTFFVFDNMSIEEACSRADPHNVNYTKELVTNLIKSLPER